MTFLTNTSGGYFLSGIKSRYSGLFFFMENKMFRILDDFLTSNKLISNNKNNNINNNINDVFLNMPAGCNSFIIKSDKWLTLPFDVKEPYDNSEFGRHYELIHNDCYEKENDYKKNHLKNKVKNKLIIKFTKDDNYSIYVVIQGDFVNENIGRWAKVTYTYDSKRNSPPSERYIYEAIKIKGEFVISASFSLEKAISEGSNVLKKITQLAKKQKTKKETHLKLIEKSIKSLIVKNGKEEGIFAGLPWFFQFWSRDELISTKGLMIAKMNKEAKSILIRNLNSISYDGRLPNQTLPLSQKINADSIGWLFKRIEEYKGWNKQELALIKKNLIKSIDLIINNYMVDYLIYNKPLETWMDTGWDNDNRGGFRIEIQALFLNMLRYAHGITKKKRYKELEQHVKNKVKGQFWNDEYLADGLNDWTKRPNVFIAAYIYPSLLTEEEWKTCFKNMFPSLWLNWGGLSSIDKKSHLFCSKHTGEITQSYHRGDSWFWINNIAAIVLHRTSKKDFSKYINKIYESSMKEFLKLGVVGQHSELSSASSLKSEGCLTQAWSNATLLELVKTIKP